MRADVGQAEVGVRLDEALASGGPGAIDPGSARGLVSAGIGIALVPASAQTIGLAGVLYRPLREATPVARLALAWPREDRSPVLAAFLDTVRRVAKRFAAAGARKM